MKLGFFSGKQPNAVRPPQACSVRLVLLLYHFLNADLYLLLAAAVPTGQLWGVPQAGLIVRQGFVCLSFPFVGAFAEGFNGLYMLVQCQQA